VESYYNNYALLTFIPIVDSANR